MLELTEESFDTDATGGVAVVDFWAEWCGPCKTLAPAFAAAAASLDTQAVFAKVNVDEAPALAQRFQVLSIPTIIVLRDGEVVGRIVGARPARQLHDELERLIA